MARDGDGIPVAGAGPAGLAAAITLARAGRRVVVHEAQREVGFRHRHDLQGIENWTTAQDALQVLRDMGITTTFASLPCYAGMAFDARGRSYPVCSRAPIFYIIERGPGPGTLDQALLGQVLALGVEVRFGSRLKQLNGPGVLATGPRAADAIAVGYHFETRMHDGFWIILDNRLAPGGYAYLLVMNARGTVKTCMFAGFKEHAVYVQRTVEAFRRLAGLEMDNARFHAGVGTLRIPSRAIAGGYPIAGEQAGFQDLFAGFGMRLAMQSGVLAARGLLDGGNYEERWRSELAPWLHATLVTRAWYSLLGNVGYRALLAYQSRRDARDFLHLLYRPSTLKRRLAPLAQLCYRSHCDQS